MRILLVFLCLLFFFFLSSLPFYLAFSLSSNSIMSVCLIVPCLPFVSLHVCQSVVLFVSLSVFLTISLFYGQFLQMTTNIYIYNIVLYPCLLYVQEVLAHSIQQLAIYKGSRLLGHTVYTKREEIQENPAPCTIYVLPRTWIRRCLFTPP